MAGFLERVKQALGMRTVPEDVGTLYARARDEREALALLRQARSRDEERVARALQDLEVLGGKERALLEEGRAERSEPRRLLLARVLREVRARSADIHSRVENLYQKRMRIYSEHIQSLETIVQLRDEPLPDPRAMEDAAIQARERLDRLDQAFLTAEGIAATAAPAPISEEERAILAEFGPGTAPGTVPPALPEPRSPGSPAPGP